MTIEAAFVTTGFLALFLCIILGGWTAIKITRLSMTLTVFMGSVALVCFILATWWGVEL